MMTLPFLAAVPGFAQNFQVTGGKVSLLREGRDTVVIDTLCMRVSDKWVCDIISNTQPPSQTNASQENGKSLGYILITFLGSVILSIAVFVKYKHALFSLYLCMFILYVVIPIVTYFKGDLTSSWISFLGFFWGVLPFLAEKLVVLKNEAMQK